MTLVANEVANEVARERLRATVRETLDAVRAGTLAADVAEQAVMDAAQQWVTEGYVINARPAAPCPGSGTTVDRYEMPGPFADPDGFYADAPDPGPYTDGERVTCPSCAVEVPVTSIANTLRSAGRQYVARFAQH